MPKPVDASHCTIQCDPGCHQAVVTFDGLQLLLSYTVEEDLSGQYPALDAIAINGAWVSAFELFSADQFERWQSALESTLLEARADAMAEAAIERCVDGVPA